MMLAELSLNVRHLPSLQNRETVLSNLLARAPLGIAAQGFPLGRWRPAAGTEPGIVPVPPLFRLAGRSFCGVVRPCGDGLGGPDRLSGPPLRGFPP